MEAEAQITSRPSSCFLSVIEVSLRILISSCRMQYSNSSSIVFMVMVDLEEAQMASKIKENPAPLVEKYTGVMAET